MNVRYINPFVFATTNVFQTMLACEIERRELLLKDDDLPTLEVAAVIDLSGKARGAVVISVAPEVAFLIVRAMLEIEIEEVNSDVIDAIGEVANMIAGGAKTFLSEYEMQLGLPRVVTGAEPNVDYPSGVRPLRVLFETSAGAVALDVGLDTTGVESEQELVAQ